MNKVAIVDYGMCNLDSVFRAVEECGGNAVITDKESEIKTASRIILPGVGAFPDAMRNLAQRGLPEFLKEQATDKCIPFLGICLGMQLLASKGSEVEETKGLDIIPGEIKRLEPYGDDTRIPHVGWNEVHPSKDSPLFRDIMPGRDFYFIHSYCFRPDNQSDALAHTPYARGFVSAVSRGLVFGVQFHPEKSQKAGFCLLKNFMSI